MAETRCFDLTLKSVHLHLLYILRVVFLTTLPTI